MKISAEGGVKGRRKSDCEVCAPLLKITYSSEVVVFFPPFFVVVFLVAVLLVAMGAQTCSWSVKDRLDGFPVIACPVYIVF